MEGQLGILVGGRTELALFTAINSLPLTAYRFLPPNRLLPVRPSRFSSSSHTRTSFSSPLSGSIAAAIRNNLGVFFLKHVAPHKNVVHGWLKPR